MDQRFPPFDDVMSIATELSEQKPCAECGEGLECADGWCGAMPAMAQQRVCPPGFTRYVIRRGESLITIARNFNISLALLLQYNPDINPYFYRAGEELCLPNVSGYCSGGRLYTIKPGDTLQAIATAYGVPLDQLIRANPYINQNNLLPGQIICIPPAAKPVPPAPAPPAPVPPAPACPTGYTAYTVRQGDSFAAIQITYNVSYQALAQANPNVNLDALAPGTALCIPPAGSRGTCPGGGGTYVVKSGETPISIAQTLGVPLGSLLRANPMLAPADFIAGRVICIPAKA